MNDLYRLKHNIYIYYSGTPPVRQSAMTQPVQGPLYGLCHHTRVLLSEHIPTLCKIIIRDYDYAPKKM